MGSRQIKKINSRIKPLFNTLVPLIMLLVTATSCLASTITLQWDPETAADLAGYKVYYADSPTAPFTGTGATQGASPVSITPTTTATITGLDPAREYYFAVTAYNTAGVESPYSNIVVVPELLPPTVQITSPAANSVVTGTVSVNAFASDNSAVSSVRFFVNGALASTVADAPYVFSWNTSTLAAGSYTITAEAVDAANNVGKSAAVTVQLVANDTSAPAVSVQNPASGATVSGTVPVTVTATDNVAISGIQIYQDGALLLAGNQSPMTFNWNTAALSNGSHVISAKATDTAGNVSPTASVTVNVQNDPVAPAVSITSPYSGSTVSGTVALSANASDNVAVKKVEFYLNGVLKFTSTVAPYGASWNTALVSNGAYTLTAKAYDAAGNAGVSAAVSLNVQNATADITAPSVTSFSLPAISNSTTVAITAFSAADNVGVTGYLVTQSSVAPLATASGWSPARPASVTFSGTGSRTAYAWAKDAAGNVSLAKSATTVIDTQLPVINTLTLGTSGNVVTLRVAATDNVAVNRIEVYLDNVLQVRSYASSLTHSWEGKRSQILSVKVYDTAGNVRTQSLKVSRN